MRKLASPSGLSLSSLEMLATAAGGLGLSLRGWWEDVNESPAWQDGVFFSLSAAYAFVSAVALVRHCAHANPVPKMFVPLYLDFMCMCFFYKQKCAQICIWLFLGIDDNPLVELVSKVFISAVSFIAVLGFLIYGGRCRKGGNCDRNLLYLFPDKMHCGEYLVLIQSLYFFQPYIVLLIGWQVTLSSFDADLSLEVLDHPILDFFYYMFTEILPSALVLFILRKLPPKRVSAQYHSIH
ncbi:hypothetical protein PR202_ga12524 [Eleusine coracana subsp. coracana]|uniref:THH1/TOM1/TOM3 domain-containing protein n=1 Tax=Eleusine coracana subsp. coracana TaxID=191504 RepID=A0AAV5CCC4_ELECO|nr:hypothetical protein PR202_ga12524 [Eleusine coracana subsp. coracana]